MLRVLCGSFLLKSVCAFHAAASAGSKRNPLQKSKVITRNGGVEADVVL